MKKILKIFLTIMLFIPVVLNAKEINLYLFYGDGCPHCAEEEKFLEKYMKENSDVELNKYEVWYSSENQTKFSKVQEITETDATGVPYLVIGNSVISGFAKGYTEDRIEEYIDYYSKRDYEDSVGIYLGVVEPQDETSSQSGEYIEEEFNIPILGKKEAKEVSLSLLAVVVGLVDGFNPCAMWILIFLISMLIGMHNKKRMWILGITFLTSSALVYFLFMISWLNLAVFLNKIIYIRLGISLIAIVLGGYSIFNYIKSLNKDTGCEVVDTKKRKKIINSISSIVKEKTFIIAILGVIALAISVNIIELMCSLGLPVMFTQILSLNDLSKTSQLIYMLIYIFFFLLDDLVVFIIAMKTMEIKAISNKYGKYSHLIGGIIMLLIGALLLFKPEWIMFNF